MTDLFDAEYFDEEFYVCRTGTKGGKRDVEIPVFPFYVSLMLECFGGKGFKFLDIGCGVGLRTMHYINAGEDAIGFDVSKYAYEHSALPDEKKVLGDVRNIAEIFPENSFDVINCERTMSYLPEEDANEIIKNLAKVTKKYVMFAIICTDHKDQNLQVAGKPGRLNINTKEYWENLFFLNGLMIDFEKTKIMRPEYWDCTWVVRKQGV